MVRKVAKDEKSLKSLLQEFTTPKEYSEIVTRFEILIRLHEGEAQRKIASDLGLGIATVTRGSHELSQRARIFKKLIDTL